MIVTTLHSSLMESLTLGGMIEMAIHVISGLARIIIQLAIITPVNVVWKDLALTKVSRATATAIWPWIYLIKVING